jgi:ribosomal protein S18 acetylase RimI-like enzyme
MLRNAPAVDRVESQLLLFEAGEFADLFAGPEFKIYPRLFLECDIRRKPEVVGAASRKTAPDTVPEGLYLVPWTPMDYQPAGELIYASYLGHSDALINDQYRSLHGSLRFLHNIVRFPGCGIFEPNFSWLLRECKGGAMVGMALCSRVAPEVAHITQLCVAKEYRGTGLGRMLLAQAAERLRRGGFEAISLTVTEANVPAVKLYERFGFTRRHRFDAMVMDPRYKAR